MHTLIHIYMLRIQYSFGRQSSLNSHYFEFQAFKKRYAQKVWGKYHCDDVFPYKQKLFEEELHGHMHHIVGVMEHNFTSTQYIRRCIDGLKPKMVILGDCNDGDIPQSRSRKYKHPLHLAEDMPCKQRVAEALQHRLTHEARAYFYPQRQMFLHIDLEEKRIVAEPYLSAAYQTIERPTCKLAFGKPSDVVLFEDLMLRMNIDEMRDMFWRVVGVIKDKHSADTHFRESFVVECMRNYAMASQPALYSREVLYVTALLHSYSKIQERILLMVPTYFAQQIAQNVHKIDISPDAIYTTHSFRSTGESAERLNTIIAQNNIEELLQKLAILCFLKKNKIQEQFVLGHNVFKHSIFSAMLGEQSASKELVPLYMSIRSQYSTALNDIRRDRIARLEYTPIQTTKMNLSQQFDKLEQRYATFPLTLAARNLNTIREQNHGVVELKKKIKQMVYSEGNDRDVRLFEEMGKGNITKEGIIYYSKLVGKANIQLGNRLKLPLHHYSAFRGIYMEYMKEKMLNIDESEERKQAKKRKIQEQIKSYKKLTDPQEIKKYISGEMGKVYNLNIVEEDGELKVNEGQNEESISQIFKKISQEQTIQQS